MQREEQRRQQFGAASQEQDHPRRLQPRADAHGQNTRVQPEVSQPDEPLIPLSGAADKTRHARVQNPTPIASCIVQPTNTNSICIGSSYHTTPA